MTACRPCGGSLRPALEQRAFPRSQGSWWEVIRCLLSPHCDTPPLPSFIPSEIPLPPLLPSLFCLLSLSLSFAPVTEQPAVSEWFHTWTPPSPHQPRPVSVILLIIPASLCRGAMQPKDIQRPVRYSPSRSAVPLFLFKWTPTDLRSFWSKKKKKLIHKHNLGATLGIFFLTKRGNSQIYRKIEMIQEQKREKRLSILYYLYIFVLWLCNFSKWPSLNWQMSWFQQNEKRGTKDFHSLMTDHSSFSPRRSTRARSPGCFIDPSLIYLHLCFKNHTMKWNSLLTWLGYCRCFDCSATRQ